MKQSAILFLFSVFITICSGIFLKDLDHCSKREYLAKNVTVLIENCDALPCSFGRQENIPMKIYFSPTTTISAFKVKISAVVVFRLKLSGIESDGCKYDQNMCPLIEKNPSFISMLINVPKAAPRKVLSVRVELNSNQGHILCFDLGVKII
ncbi:hypothetical protein HZS_5711 [Henneguya salminicola]|nr:hypothetical protein HZS_5711 [Henneguya salminicola]